MPMPRTERSGIRGRDFCLSARTSRPRGEGRQSRKNHLSPSSPPISPPIRQRTARPPPASSSDKPAPAADIRTHESPHAAGVTQAPAGATDHEQIRAAVSGRDCGWQVERLNAREEGIVVCDGWSSSGRMYTRAMFVYIKLCGHLP